jgi:hypothetical protein
MSVDGTIAKCRLRRAMSEFEGKAEDIYSYRVRLTLTRSRLPVREIGCATEHNAAALSDFADEDAGAGSASAPLPLGCRFIGAFYATLLGPFVSSDNHDVLAI